jgi:biotin synthase-like enzyme
MHVVRHDAKRVDKKRANRRVFSQAGNEPRAKARICPEAATIVEAERDKIQIAAAITVGVKPEVFAPEVSGRGHNRGTQDAALKAVDKAYTRYV